MNSTTTRKPDTVTLRMAKREDCPAILQLKRELAAYHSRPDPQSVSLEEFQRDGFDVEPPWYYCLLAEVEVPCSEGEGGGESNSESKIVGHALYYYGYETWEGKAIYLKDLIVSREFRGHGIGSKLIKKLAKIAIEENCFRIKLEAHHFNESGQKFYESMGGWNSTKLIGWHNFKLDKEDIKRLVEKI